MMKRLLTMVAAWLVLVPSQVHSQNLIRCPRISFDVPVFPACQVGPEIVARAEGTAVIATGLMSNESVHLFLGDELVADSMSNGDGSATIEFTVSTDAELGDRLVTVGVARCDSGLLWARDSRAVERLVGDNRFDTRMVST